MSIALKSNCRLLIAPAVAAADVYEQDVASVIEFITQRSAWLATTPQLDRQTATASTRGGASLRSRGRPHMSQ
jgi:hypothetical protein